MPPQRQSVPPYPGSATAIGAPAPPVPPEKLSTLFAPPVHPPNLPLTPAGAAGSRQHESLLVPAPAGPPIIALAAKTAPPTMRDLRILLAGDPLVRREQVGQALTWLLDNLDRPQVVAVTCAALGPALQQVGASLQRLDAMGVLVADALRATVGGTWRQEHYDAWHSSARLVTSWMGQGMARVDYEPAFWTATVVGHERRGDRGALLNLRTYLPYPFGPGQFATVESARHPQLWHPYWIASLPRDDNTVAIEVRATPGDLVADALVDATGVGDRVRLRPALGGLAPDHDSTRDLLLIAYDTGIAPMKALLADLRRHRDVRRVHLLWTADRDYVDVDVLASLTRFDRDDLAAAVTGGDWTGHDVYVTGSPEEVRDAVAVLSGAGVPVDRIHRAALVGPEFEPVIPATA
jgi:ferredoxin-NADP reductase